MVQDPHEEIPALLLSGATGIRAQDLRCREPVMGASARSTGPPEREQIAAIWLLHQYQTSCLLRFWARETRASLELHGRFVPSATLLLAGNEVLQLS